MSNIFILLLVCCGTMLGLVHAAGKSITISSHREAVDRPAVGKRQSGIGDSELGRLKFFRRKTFIVII